MYLNGSRWDVEFQRLEETFNEQNIANFVLIGDMNVRIGNDQVISAQSLRCTLKVKETRSSLDTVKDRKGTKFVEFVDDFMGVILNGRTSGDYEGNFTFISTVGKSVNDICVISESLVDVVSSFSVDQQIYSDHLPIKLSLELKLEEPVEDHIKLLPKLMWTQEDELKFTRKLDNKLQRSTMPAGSNDSLVEYMTKNIIACASCKPLKKSFVKKQPWYNYKCENARKKSFKLLNDFRTSHCEQTKQLYLHSQSQYKKICIEVKESYYNAMAAEFNCVKSSKDFWSLVKRLNNDVSKVGRTLNNIDFVTHFQSLLNPTLNAIRIQYAQQFTENSYLDAQIKQEEILEAIAQTKNNKAPGEDSITNEFFKNVPVSCIKLMQTLYNKIYDNADIPSSFKKSIVFPIFKKGNLEEATNYRGISVMNTIYKIFVGILTKRLSNWCEQSNILNEGQAGFRKNYSTIDNIFNLTNIIKIKESDKKRLYCFFIDFKAAFDRIDRHSMWLKLNQLGVSTKLLKTLQALYENTTSAIWDGKTLSDFFTTTMGVKQGCPGSSQLFILFINDLAEFIGSGITVNDTLINMLMFADDIVFLADTPEELQHMINRLEQYCLIWNMELNMMKSKVMIAAKGGRRNDNEKWTFSGQEIEICNSYKYLGVTITPRVSLKSHHSERLTVSKNAINRTWNNMLKRDTVPHSAKTHVFNSAVKSITCYASQVWGWKQYDEVEKVQRFFIKKLLCLPQCTPNYMLTTETGLDTLYIYTLRMHFEYVVKVLKLPNHRYNKKNCSLCNG